MKLFPLLAAVACIASVPACHSDSPPPVVLSQRAIIQIAKAHEVKICMIVGHSADPVSESEALVKGAMPGISDHDTGVVIGWAVSDRCPLYILKLASQLGE